MTWRDRSPEEILPDPARPYRPHVSEVADAYALGGPRGVAVVLRDLLRTRVTGRASTPAEVALLREWLAVEVADQTAHLVRRLAPREEPEDGVQADAVGEYLGPDAEPEDVEALRSGVRSALARRMTTGGLFRTCPECSAPFAPQRARTAADGLVYCSPRCRNRARRKAST